MINFSQKYQETLKKSINFHNSSVNWSGEGSYQYISHLKSIIKEYNCSSMLDYGCGKGKQYTKDPVTDFSTLIGIERYDLYDPATEQYKDLPKGTWDLVICLDVLPFIPEEDIENIIKLLVSLSNKLCVIGVQDRSNKPSKKPFVCIKSKEWWEEKLSHPKIKLIWNVSSEPFNYSKCIEQLKSGVFHSSNT